MEIKMTTKRARFIADVSSKLLKEIKSYSETNRELPSFVKDKLNDIFKLIESANEYLLSGKAEPLSKGVIFSSPAGKSRVSKSLASLLPEHEVYVEPFCGSGAVFLEKAPAGKKEVLNDMNSKMAEAWRVLGKLTDDQFNKLKKKNWTGDRTRFEKLRDSDPQDPVDKLYRFLYVRRFSFGSWDKTYSPGDQGKTSTIPSKVEKYRDRIKGVKVYSGDYEKVMKKYDSPSTVFFLDPPYVGFNSEVDEDSFDEERFFNVLKSLKGKWLLTYGEKGELPKMLKSAGYKIKSFDTARSLSNVKEASNKRVLKNILISNYDLPRRSV